MNLIPASSLNPSSIYCVGKNYLRHAKEMLQWESNDENIKRSTKKPEEPIIFLKPATALSRNGKVRVPHFHGKPISKNLHYEAELVVLISKDAENIPTENTMSFIGGYGIGLDMTLRDVQMDAKEKGEPWLKCKGFKSSALVSDMVPATHILSPETLVFSLSLNDAIVQKGKAETMLFNIPELISYLSYIYGLQAGDLLFTGTPEGVGKVNNGDMLHAELLQNNCCRDFTLLTSLDAVVEAV
ncbi:fumarylacetoacetate hydrolase family protein [Prosthecochloris sp.]|uniref:fumarylacetoacetate hydrolase family protein n=1 Tax=Prosthecochloris sp. TaxID=290513 RepID=UPI002580E6C0|nr:fumarylacetoacetate hydrolase family protein [Prosthecochloris sp.]